MPLPNYLKSGGKEPSRTVAGLSDKRRWERIGRVRLGIKVVQIVEGKNPDGSQKTKIHPKEVPVFLCPPELVEQFGEDANTATIPSDVAGGPLNIREWFKKNGLPLPAKVVTKLKVVFPGDPDVSVAEMLPQAVPQNLKRYGQSYGLKCFGDGYIAHEKQKDGSWKEIPCPDGCANKKLSSDPNPRDVSYAETGECKANGDLMFMSMDPRKKDYARALSLGCWQMNTKSIENIIHVNSYLDRVVATFMQEFRGKRSFSWVPLWMTRVEREIQHPKFGKVRHFYVRLEIDPDFMARLSEQRDRQLPISKERVALAPPIPVDDGDDEAPGGMTVTETNEGGKPSWTLEEEEGIPGAENPPEGSQSGQEAPKAPPEAQKPTATEGKPKEAPKEGKKGPKGASDAPKATETTPKPAEAAKGAQGPSPGGDLFEPSPEESEYIKAKETLRQLLEGTGEAKDKAIWKACQDALNKTAGTPAKLAAVRTYLSDNKARLDNQRKAGNS